ncbi:MAG: 30S ribosomal protein S1 [Flavobacteriales bacterium]
MAERKRTTKKAASTKEAKKEQEDQNSGQEQGKEAQKEAQEGSQKGSQEEGATPEEEKEVVEPPTPETTVDKEGVAVVKELPQEAFDWEGMDSRQDDYTQEERDQLDELYQNTLTSIEEKQVVTGKVVGITKKEVVINIGYKSEGVVPRSEFRYNPDLKEGDEVEVFVEKQEDSEGQLVLSHKKARTHKAWERVNQAMENDEVIPGYIKCRTKGGLIADVYGIEAFLPGSQIDVKQIRDYDQYVGKEMDFKVVKINKEFKNVVVSHKALIEAELEEQKKRIIGNLEKGQVLEGTVKNITSYGVFIDLGGVDGLIHITDLSWGRINHPEEVVELDQTLNVVILDFDDDKKRIALGLKQLNDHPWDQLDENLKEGDRVKGKVVVMADYGAFVEIQPGVEGLIHVSEMSWSQHLRSAQDFLSVGDEVEAEILTLDREERKMSLSMKRLMEDPWQNIEQKYPVDSQHTGKVRNFTNFGVFVELEEGIDGLVHISDLSWSRKIKHPSEFCNIGDPLDVIVLEIDKDERKLSLGHKQLEENPWEVFESVFTVGSVHKGTITEVGDKMATIVLPYGVEAYCPLKQTKKEDGEQAKVDETLDFKVIEFNKRGKRIVVSHSKTFEEEDAEGEGEQQKQQPKKKKGDKATKKAVKEVNKNVEKTTLGDLDALNEIREEMDESQKSSSSSKKKGDDDEDEEEETDDS